MRYIVYLRCMLYTKSHIQERVIRFSRWSGKGYAIFMGLRANVVIGRLAKGVVDALLPKSGSMEALALSFSQFEGLNLEVESDDSCTFEDMIIAPTCDTAQAHSVMFFQNFRRGICCKWIASFFYINCYDRVY